MRFYAGEGHAGWTPLPPAGLGDAAASSQGQLVNRRTPRPRRGPLRSPRLARDKTDFTGTARPGGPRCLGSDPPAMRDQLAPCGSGIAQSPPCNRVTSALTHWPH
jgi:hypothetical protein